MPARSKRKRATGSRVSQGVKKRQRKSKADRQLQRTGGFLAPTANPLELKFFDTTITLTALADTGTIVSSSLNLLSQGTGNEELIGRTCTVKTIQVRGLLRLLAASHATPNALNTAGSYAMYLAIDTQCNGAAPTIATMFEDTDLDSYVNLENSKRYIILKKWMGSINSTCATFDATNDYTTFEREQRIKHFRRVDIPLEFADSAAGNIADVRTNNIFLCGFSNVGTVSFTGRVRLRYSDA